jgi:hypothetical protein
MEVLTLSAASGVTQTLEIASCLRRNSGAVGTRALVACHPARPFADHVIVDGAFAQIVDGRASRLEELA